MLEGRAEHDVRVSPENIFAAVAMVDIEINDAYALHVVLRHGMCHAHCHIVENAETGSTRSTRMMAGWAYAAESIVGFAIHYQIGCQHYGASGMQRGRQCHRRSEEHTSELQSLMRISYAVFCLKKKKTKIKT